MKKILSVFVFFVLLLSLVPAATAAPGDPVLLVDDAGLLNSSEENELLSQLTEISERHKLNVAVVTVRSLGGKSARRFADDYFGENGYGYGSSEDGVMLVVAMSDRELYITTAGKAIRAFTDAGIEYIGDEIAPYLSDGDYADAFELFAVLCDDFISQYESGSSYDVGNLPKGAFPLKNYALISLVVGVVAAAISVGVMAGQLKSVRKKAGASNYMKAGSPNITEMRDLYLYSTVKSTPRNTENNSRGGGSSIHSSSSGISHGGGGRKF